VVGLSNLLKLEKQPPIEPHPVNLLWVLYIQKRTEASGF
jgi:hypothetical protein